MNRELSAFVFVVALAVAGNVNAELRLPAIISDHGMLQGDKPIAIWGWATPGATVKATFEYLNHEPSGRFTTIVDSSGKWVGFLPPLKDGTTGSLDVVSNHDGNKTVNDLLVGEVWLGGGQSNMQYPIGGSGFIDLDNPDEVKAVKQNIAIAKLEAVAARPPIRYFKMPGNHSEQVLDDVKGQWLLADANNVETFSAVAWNFAVALQNKLHQPIGLIVSSIGGTTAQAWMSREALEATSVGAAIEQRHREHLAAEAPGAEAKYQVELKAWQSANPTPELEFKNRNAKPKPPYSLSVSAMPLIFYNAMLHGLEPYTLRGIIWFQADGNIAYPLEYSELFLALIREWRAEWHEQLPFYFVEMNNMNEDKQTKPVEANNLSILREQQHAALQLPGVGMVTAVDLGTKNAHFPNKKPVGERLANLALHESYGLPGQPNSPMFQAYSIQGNKIRLKFSDSEGLRVRGGGQPTGYAIRGADSDWVWAAGKIECKEIVLWSNQVASPVAVRYAWASNPVISIENGEGLPLYPFRTDNNSPR
ncbi:MAG: sialate O-acetylesterase [Acidobacteriaceae bacterium]|jgi:sialate O-acetylesterase|nr:sialate O-acetylesterase [Acidobacteriaceae bacterium]